MVSPTAVQTYGEDFALHPVGTGPFRFVEYVSDDHLLLERNPDYWETNAAGNQLPYLDGLDYRIVPDETVRLANIESGTLDFMTVVPQKDVERLRGEDSLTFMEGPSQAVYTLRVNNIKPPFDNEHLRRAVAWGIDRQAIGDTVFFGVGSPAVNVLSPAQWAFAPDQFEYVSYEYDPEKAREELALSGQPDGFTFQLESRNQPTFIQFAEAVAAQLSTVGITAEVLAKEQVTSLEDMRASNFHMATGRDTGTADPGKSIANEFHCGVENLAGPYCNPEFDTLVDSAASEPDREKKLAILAEAANFINSQALRIYIWNDVETAVMRKEVMGYQMYGHGKMKLKDVWMAE
jgi:peptide/nickel transport system substrate-binding protein